MIQVHLVLTRIPSPQGYQQVYMDKAGVYLNPARIDTVTPIESAEERARESLPDTVRSVIRYDDNREGFRLIFVRNTAASIARARRREVTGEDSDTTDFGSAAHGAE